MGEWVREMKRVSGRVGQRESVSGRVSERDGELVRE